MNYWGIIFTSYFQTASMNNLFWRALKNGSLFNKCLIIGALLLCIFGFYFFYQNDVKYTGFILGGIGAISLVVILEKLRSNFVFNEFGEVPSLAGVDSNKNIQTRYLMFEQSLKKQNITCKQVNNCFGMLDTKIQLVSQSVLFFKAFLAFVVTVLLSIIGVIFSKMDVSDLGLIMIVVIMLSTFLMVLLMIRSPTKKEQLYELKYFMQLYCLKE